MSIKLFVQAILKFTLGIILVELCLFLPAGSSSFTNGWLLLGVLFVPMFFAGIVMMFKNPKMLEKRLDINESQSDQKVVVTITAVMFITGFIVSGLNFRFKWHTLPKGIVIISTVIFLVSYIIYAEVLKENIYLSRTIKVEENQKVINTGLYSIVRHPMYFATVFMFLSIPLILGSLYSFFIFLPYPLIIAKRIISEEKLLENELVGYCEYKKKVKYRLIPFIW